MPLQQNNVMFVSQQTILHIIPAALYIKSRRRKCKLPVRRLFSVMSQVMKVKSHTIRL